MYNIAIISSSIRKDRLSHRAALYFKFYLENNNLADVRILDLLEYNFPLFTERLKYQDSPSDTALDFVAKVKGADGLIIIVPEYNGGYPASLKNVLDLLVEEWHHKPVAISTVSSGSFGGTQVITQLQFVLWKMKALVAPAYFPIPNIAGTIDATGMPGANPAFEKRTAQFATELFEMIDVAKG